MVPVISIAAALAVAVLAYFLAAARRDNRWLTAQVQREREALGTMREAFQSLAADALHTNRAAFLDSLDARQKVFDGLVQPIAETLKHVDVKLAQAEHERIDAYARLTEKVSALGSSTETLSRALRTPAVRGRWGEMQLRRVVEIAGMLPRCDFDEQPSLHGENGRLRPDLIVRLPGGKQVVVDAKAPLEAFLDAQDAADDEMRTVKLQAHARQVREHVEKLGSKAYWEALERSPEFVVLFLPGETLFSAALQNDLSLIEYGLKRRVLLASPITLIALLTTVAHSWRQEALAENFREVAALGHEQGANV
jgi:DNA recombination protein RmuC